MRPSPQSDDGCVRLLLFRNEAREILAVESAGASALPTVVVPAHSRIAEELTCAIHTLWGLSLCCLFALPVGLDRNSDHYQVAEAYDRTGGLPAHMRWISVASLTGLPSADIAAIHAALEAFDLYRSDPSVGSFGKPGWFASLVDWVSVEAAGMGLELTGEFRHLNASPTFSLIRFETSGPALWFKAVGEPNRDEYRITVELARRFPTHVPRLVASRPEWNAWLSIEAEGKQLTPASRTADWINTAATLADLQIASYGYGLHLIELGSKDLRPDILSDRVDPFFACMKELMRAQVKETPAPLTSSEIISLAEEVQRGIEELGQSKLPNVLGHLDCNPGNIIVSERSCAFLDWAEAYVGHPFFTLQYLLEFRRKFHGNGHREEQEIAQTYTDRWSSFLASSQIAGDWPLIPLLAVFAYAARDTHSFTLPIHPNRARFLRSMTRRMKREADALRQQRSVCAR